MSGTASVKVEGDALAASAKDAFAGSQGGSLSVNLTSQEVLARAETPISVQSVAGGQALARAVAGPAFVALTAADVLNKFTRGVRRIPLDELGVSPVNRRINGPYVHQLGRRILSVEGFTRLRYRNGLCHEPSPDDPLAVARFTNAAAQGSGLLSPVPVKALFGSFGKSHLLSFLQALKSGQVYWNETQDLMLPVAAQQELMEHLQHGMFYEVLAWEAVRDHGPALQALMAADNFDAGFALGQTELQLLRSMREAIVVCRPPVGLTVFDVCLQEVERTLGARWRQEELVCFFNFALTVGAEHLEFLGEVVDTHVDASRLAVRPSDFQSAARLCPKAPWCKVAFLTLQYMSPPHKCVAGPGGRSFGNVLDKTAWARLVALHPDALAGVEVFLRDILARYSFEDLPGLSRRAWITEIPALFTRVATQVVLAADMALVGLKFPKIELKLREMWAATTKLPPPVLAEPAAASETSTGRGASCAGGRGASCAGASGASCSSAQSSTWSATKPDSTPAVSFVAGAAVCDFPTLARSRGITSGVHVRCVRPHEDILADQWGQVTKVEATSLEVAWKTGDGSAESKTVLRACTDVGCLLVGKPPPQSLARADEAKASVQERLLVQAKAVLALPKGLAWTSSSRQAPLDAAAHMVAGAMWQFADAHALGPEDLRVWEKLERKKKVLHFASVASFQARQLVLLPWPAEVLTAKPANVRVEQVCLRVPVDFAGATAELFLLSDLAAAPRTEPTASGDARVLHPFWDILSASKAGQRLVLRREWVEIPLGSAVAKGPLRLKGKGGKRVLKAAIPFLTNETLVSPGDRVWCEVAALEDSDLDES